MGTSLVDGNEPELFALHQGIVFVRDLFGTERGRDLWRQGGYGRIAFVTDNDNNLRDMENPGNDHNTSDARRMLLVAMITAEAAALNRLYRYNLLHPAAGGSIPVHGVTVPRQHNAEMVRAHYLAWCAQSAE